MKKKKENDKINHRNIKDLKRYNYVPALQLPQKQELRSTELRARSGSSLVVGNEGWIGPSRKLLCLS